MKGSVYPRRDRGTWIVSFPHNGKSHKITKYKGEIMYSSKIAQKCLAMIQADYENCTSGNGVFRIEKYIQAGWSNVQEVFQEWLEYKSETKKPATVKGYRSYYRNWIEPFFSKNPIMIHEVNAAVLNKLLRSIKLSGKGKWNVMNAFHAFLDFAWREGHITAIPPFPRKGEYNLVDPDIVWAPREIQMEIVSHIPENERAPFLWLIYHYRRPSEACALYKSDYDPVNDAFYIRRSISARKMVDSTKTGAVHILACDEQFRSLLFELLKKNENSPFLFVNPRARKSGRYTNESLNTIWKTACQKAGVDIPLYAGTKHSACTNYLEDGGNLSDLQILTDHKNPASVKRYAKITLEKKRALMRQRSHRGDGRKKIRAIK